MKHKHADLIKAWADGAKIQVYMISLDEWEDCPHDPTWNVGRMYRIKPEQKPEITVDSHILTLNLRFTIERDGALMKFIDVELIK